MLDTYKFLFPYEKIPKESRILIYGAGDIGQDYLRQMMMTRYANVLGFIDKNFDKYPAMVVPVYPPEKIADFEFDYIVLAFKMGNFAKDVGATLKRHGVPSEKIIFQGARNDAGVIVLKEKNGDKGIKHPPAYEKAKLSIALKYGPGLGDAVIKKKLFLEIARMAPEALIDIYSPNGSLFIPSIYGDQPQFNEIFDDGGALYAANNKKYSLSMSVYYMILIDYMDNDAIKAINPFFADKMITHEKRHGDYSLGLFPVTQNWIHFCRSRYRGFNCYTLYNYTGVFNIVDMAVSIPLNTTAREEYGNLIRKKYMTFNFGNGIAGKGNKQSISKQWPKEYFEKFIKLFKRKYPNIAVVQLGDKTVGRLDGADNALLGEEFEIVKSVLAGALFHLDIEGGLMHLATQLGTRCFVLFGTTPTFLFGYPQNVNITAGGCHGCYCLYEDSYQCARGMEKPECMWSITPEIVMEKIMENIQLSV